MSSFSDGFISGLSTGVAFMAILMILTSRDDDPVSQVVLNDAVVVCDVHGGLLKIRTHGQGADLWCVDGSQYNFQSSKK